jgi:hypothetical protein
VRAVRAVDEIVERQLVQGFDLACAPARRP